MPGNAVEVRGRLAPAPLSGTLGSTHGSSGVAQASGLLYRALPVRKAPTRPNLAAAAQRLWNYGAGRPEACATADRRSALRVTPSRPFRALVAAVSLLIALVASAPNAGARSQTSPSLSEWEHSIVSLEVAQKQYDYYQPWTKRTQRLRKAGLVVGERQILTTADELFDRTLVRLQKGGRGRWWTGEVTWIDYHANLALVSAPDADFWRDLKPVVFGGAMPADGALQILRWSEGNLENRKAEFTQFVVREGQLSQLDQVVLEAGSEIQGVGWGEPLVANSHVVGIVRAQDGRTCIAMPASCIQSILDVRKKGVYRGLGYFHFYWQPAQNPATLAELSLPGEPRGVIVIDVPARPDTCDRVLRPKDILLQIEGFDLDIQGDYNDPEFGHLMLENLATRHKWAGDEVKMKIWREGKPLEVSYRLPKFDYTNALVPHATYDQEPEYLIVGGMVFQPLTDSYLQSWGSDWKHRSPFRLHYYDEQPPTKDRPALVLLSQVLPDAFNIGYQEQRWLVVDKVNGQPVSRLSELRDALQKPVDGFHIIEFMQSDSLRRIVIAAGSSEEAATQRVLKRYGITEASHFADNAAK
jgi:hypothetical protein